MPVARGQMTIPRRSASQGPDLDALREEIDKKADAAETAAALGRKANATTVGGIATSLKATQDDVEELKAIVQP